MMVLANAGLQEEAHHTVSARWLRMNDTRSHHRLKVGIAKQRTRVHI